MSTVDTIHEIADLLHTVRYARVSGANCRLKKEVTIFICKK
jgi:hypothetical protein